MKIEPYKPFIANEYFVISLYLTGNCNVRCPYCFWFRDGETTTNVSMDELEKLIKVLKFSKRKIIFNLMGGEPTVHPEILKILDRLKEETDENFIINLLTNFTKPIELFNKMPLEDMSLTISFHGTLFTTKEEIDVFIKKIDSIYIRTKSIRIFCILLDEYSDNIKYFLQNINPSYKIKPVFLSSENAGPMNLPSKEFAESVKHYFNNESNFLLENDILKNSFDIVMNRENIYTGWTCNQTYFDLFPDGTLKDNCEHFTVNILKEPFFLRNYTPKIICKQPICDVFSQQMLKKEKNAN